MKISVIIPAYNEAKRISTTLQSVQDFFVGKDFEYEIIVVNDGSRDTTTEVIYKIAHRIPQIILIDNHHNQGKGFAVRDGIHRATGDLILFMDADNSTTIDHLERVLPLLGHGYDVVIASRRMKGAHIVIHQPWLRDFLGGIFRILVRSIVPLGVTDSQTGFKAFTIQSARDIFAKQTIGGWAFDVEILAIAKACNYRIAEFPITWRNDEHSQVRFKGMLLMLFEVLRIRWNLWTGKYNKTP
jgi:glycosyltransferase involved in cell wall biosynthesis